MKSTHPDRKTKMTGTLRDKSIFGLNHQQTIGIKDRKKTDIVI